MRNFIIFAVIFFIVLFFFVGEQLIEISYNLSGARNETNESLYYTNVGITSPSVTYRFTDKESCGNYETKRVIWAFEVIENETDHIVTFEETNSSADITIYCYITAPSSQLGYITQGEATMGNYGERVHNAVINFYNTGQNRYSAGCKDYPDTEIHEILHVFGFGHSADTMSIMNWEHIVCRIDRFKIDPDIVEELKKIYNQ